MSLSQVEIKVGDIPLVHKQDDAYEKDVWELAEVGIKPPPYISVKRLSFKKIRPDWLRQLAKKYIRYQSATKAYYTLQHYVSSIVHFSNFLSQYNRPVQPQDINRSLMLSYIGYVHKLNEVNEAKNKLITHIKLMMTIASVEGFENITKEKIMFREDRLPVRHVKPRYIPNSVLNQLNLCMNELTPEIRRLVVVLQHTGRRPGEICALPLDCLIKDAEGDYFLRYYEFKMKKEETIPIQREVVAAIEEQRQSIINKFDIKKVTFLFSDNKLRPMRPDVVANSLNILGIRHLIKGPDGNLWHFQLHQFRHTVGTQMINAGVPAHIVQRYLKHTSPEMTMNYAHLHDSTMKAEFAKFQGKLVDITGKVINEKGDFALSEDLKWLKRNILAQALPNGYCGLPVQQGGCPHANACLSCSHFRTTAQFLSHHKNQLDETDRILKTATEHGWTRQIELNEKVRKNLETIITTLEQT